MPASHLRFYRAKFLFSGQAVGRREDLCPLSGDIGIFWGSGPRRTLELGVAEEAARTGAPIRRGTAMKQ